MSRIDEFIARWSGSEGSERGNSQRFLTELITALDLPPMPTDPAETPTYEFEHAVPYKDQDGATRNLFIDLYKRGCFVLESKQGVEARTLSTLEKIAARPRKAGTKRGTTAWDQLMTSAFHQAETYVRRIPPEEGRPPFIIVLDVGFAFDLYAEFSRTGGYYAPFPAPGRHHFSLEDLARPEVRAMLAAIWTDPLSLDPARQSARVTREIAAHLAELAKSLETDLAPDQAAAFLMRCLFTMFAEDVGLLPEACFQRILQSSLDQPEGFAPLAEELWRAMDKGGFSVAVRGKLLRFNGGIFADPTAHPLSHTQIAVLLKAAEADWQSVEPAIFGTLLERALNPRERHKLGAHFTPRAYVERLVAPTLITPLREEWRTVQATAAMAAEAGDTAKALKLVSAFQNRLCQLRILDPACGTGNFLYVAFELMKRLEAEVVQEEARYGGQARLLVQGAHIDPHQFLGLEINPRAAHIAEMVLWIGYLQWHFRTHGHTPPTEPIIRAFRNIEKRDAILDWDDWTYRTDEHGKPIMRWDGHSTKIDPVTGREVPDGDKQLPDTIFTNPRPAIWPEADYIVGNPPFLGKGERLRSALGDGYVDALRTAYRTVPDSADYVMYWWDKAATSLHDNKTVRFGFITTNSISQTFNRRILSQNMDLGISIAFAIPDHPWVDSADGAAVRIAMTVAINGLEQGEIQIVTQERSGEDIEAEVTLESKFGRINTDLTIGADVAQAQSLRGMSEITSNGVMLAGNGFIVNAEQAKKLGLGSTPGLERHIRPYRNGKDITQKARNFFVLDFFGFSSEQLLKDFPQVFQWLFEHVKPERDANRDRGFRENWWLFGRPRPSLRNALGGLHRFIATPETAKHRFFIFLEPEILPDHMLVGIAVDDAFFLGVLSSRIHVAWALAAGGRLGMGNDPRYNKSRCFETFPFPAATDAQRQRIRDLAEQLDAHRKARQAEHPDLTLTGMYNALEKLRAGQPFTAAEKKAHEQALGTVLLTLHTDLDAAVAEAYGWPADLSEADILTRLVALNAERVAEERQGRVRWLRPEYQAPDTLTARQQDAALPVDKPALAAKPKATIPWPKDETARVAVLLKLLRGLDREASAKDIAASIKGASATKIAHMAASLASHGLIRQGQYGYLG